MIRMTSQRQTVYDILSREAWHPTVDDIFFEAKKSLPKISQATIYRNLEGLIQDGLATKITTLNGPSRFEKAKTPHAHFECNKCGTIDDIFIDTKCIKSIMNDRALENYLTETVIVKVHGLCKSCKRGENEI